MIDMIVLIINFLCNKHPLEWQIKLFRIRKRKRQRNRMLTIIAEVIISFFISNYESEKYPYLISFFKGIVLGVSGFILGMLIDFFNKDLMDLQGILLFFLISIGIGLLASLFFMGCKWLDLNSKN